MSLKGHSAREAKGVAPVAKLALVLRGEVKKGVVPPLLLEALLPRGVVESCQQKSHLTLTSKPVDTAVS